MQQQQLHEDTCLCSVMQLDAIISYVRRAGLDALNEYQKDKLLNLTARQGMLMSTLLRLSRQQEGGGVALGSLARELHMSISSVSHLVDTLEELNLLQRNMNDDDRRSVRVSLSPAGEQCATATRKGMLKGITTLTSHLTPEENELRLRMVNKLYHIAYPTAP